MVWTYRFLFTISFFLAWPPIFYLLLSFAMSGAPDFLLPPDGSVMIALVSFYLLFISVPVAIVAFFVYLIARVMNVTVDSFFSTKFYRIVRNIILISIFPLTLLLYL